jgi:hypothetical protein
MNSIVGLVKLRLTVNDATQTAIAEISPPGVPWERVVHSVRIAWANVLAPGVSQNRIECLGWEKIDSPPQGWKRLAGHWSEPVIIWVEAAA